MKNLVDAFTDFDVTKEKHQGIINNFISDKSLICPSYHKDDIVFVKKDKKTTSMNHLFVLIDENMHGRLLTTTKKGTYVKKNSKTKFDIITN